MKMLSLLKTDLIQKGKEIIDNKFIQENLYNIDR